MARTSASSTVGVGDLIDADVGASARWGRRFVTVDGPSLRPDRWRVRRIGVLLIAFAVVSIGLIHDRSWIAPSPPPDPRSGLPTAVVAMGDSTVSGEGAGSYEPGTDGQGGNWCHRSTNAFVYRLRLPGVDELVNLGCSGAPSAQVALGDVSQYTEPSQTRRLTEIAATHRVVAVVVATGANDDPHFSHVLDRCVRGWAVQDVPGCSSVDGPDWRRRVELMRDKVERTLRDVRFALATLDYDRADYQLVLQSYAAPVGPDMLEQLRGLSGCPLGADDLQWVRDEALPEINAALRTAAGNADTRFLDLSEAGVGREACSRTDPDEEWFTRLVVRWPDLDDDQRVGHALQESFHPNAAGHAQFARCLDEFLADTEGDARCVAGQDGDLHAVVTSW